MNPIITKKKKKEMAQTMKWLQFFHTYWNLLSKEQVISYIAMMEAGDSPPLMLNPQDLDGWEQVLLKKHMGKVIRKYREKRGIDQKHLATALGKKSSHLSLIEAGEKMFTVVDLNRAIQLLEIPASEIFFVDLPPSYPPTK